MKYTVKMSSVAMINIQSFTISSLGVTKLLGGGAQTAL
jgi:hypothetical protein